MSFRHLLMIKIIWIICKNRRIITSTRGIFYWNKKTYGISRFIFLTVIFVSFAQKFHIGNGVNEEGENQPKRYDLRKLLEKYVSDFNKN